MFGEKYFCFGPDLASNGRGGRPDRHRDLGNVPGIFVVLVSPEVVVIGPTFGACWRFLGQGHLFKLSIWLTMTTIRRIFGPSACKILSVLLSNLLSKVVFTSLSIPRLGGYGDRTARAVRSPSVR